MHTTHQATLTSQWRIIVVIIIESQTNVADKDE